MISGCRWDAKKGSCLPVSILVREALGNNLEKVYSR